MMLVLDLIKQDFLKNIRSSNLYKNIAANIFYGFMALYFIGIFLFIGFFLDKMLMQTGSHFNPMLQVCGSLLYAMLSGMLMRFLMQSLVTFNLSAYQTLNIKRDTLVNFILLKPLFNPINYLTLLIVIPFAVKYVLVYYSGWNALIFCWMYLNIIWFNSMFASFLKRKYGTSLVKTLIFIALIAALMILEYFKVFSLFEISLTIFSFVVLHPLGAILVFVLPVIAFSLNKWFFSQNYYAETFNRNAASEKNIMADFTFLNRFGIEGELIALQMKLILRHKRTKTMLWMSLIFLFYGLLFYPNQAYSHSNGLLFFVALFLTGFVMIMFGQMIISSDSGHFDGLMTKNIPASTYIRSFYYMLFGFCILSFVLTTPYFLFGWKIIAFHLAAFLFNIGVNIFVLLFGATYNTKKVDLSKGSAMNYQGVSLKNFLIIVPLLGFPIFLVYLFSLFVSLNVALISLSLIGVLGLLLSPVLLKLCIKQFSERKYTLASGYRESE